MVILMWSSARLFAGVWAILPSMAVMLVERSLIAARWAWPVAVANPALAARVKDSAAEWAVPEQGPVPLAMLTTSASGLDPHLPPEAIRYQLVRVAAARHLPVQTVEQLLEQHIEQPLIGPPVVNVLALNLALDALK